MSDKIAVFSSWVGKSKPRRYAALLIFWIIFDQLFGYISHGIIGWPQQSWTHSIVYGAWMAVVFTVFYSLQSRQ